MERVKRKSILACFALLVLSACFPDNGQSSDPLAQSSTSVLSFSDPSVSEEASSIDGRVSSECVSSSLRASSEGSVSSSQSEAETLSSSSTTSLAESSLDDQDYRSVSLYQSNIGRDGSHTPGDVRFDKTIRIKIGDPLYSDSDGYHNFYFSLSPFITHHGDGAYSIAFLFVNEDCSEYYLFGTPILSDSSFYYYCAA